MSILGMVLLSYVIGAAAMFFDLPTSGVLGKAFIGGRSWNERRRATAATGPRELSPLATGQRDDPAKSFDGFTLYALYTCADVPPWGNQAFLIDMNRQLVHHWAMPFSDVWPNPPHIRDRVDDKFMCFFGCHLYANGDLLVVYQGTHDTTGGLAKLDVESNVVWKYSAGVHHDVDVGEDGTIYAIEHEVVHEMPAGLEFVPTPCLVDSLVLLSPAGEPLAKPLPILEAFRDSSYALHLSPLARPPTRSSQANDAPAKAAVAPRWDDDGQVHDPMHTNSVKVLGRELARRFPGFEPGQVLISIRNLDTIAVVDLEKRQVVWAARGPWQAQHDAHFLESGHLLIFDNRGLPVRSRVLEYDPRTQAFPWTYSGENAGPFYTRERGMSQRLPNGNTLIVNSENGEMIEVTENKVVVWTCSTGRYISTARRYAAEQVHFLKEGQRARP
ncbi:MAG TPA: arylsulfotransferase family protein [Pirellulales bacterium]|nr:arylsulfotransferase family protein [Pirellulales bacterium]